MLGCREAEELCERRGIAGKLLPRNKGFVYLLDTYLPLLFPFINIIVIWTLSVAHSVKAAFQCCLGTKGRAGRKELNA